MTGTASAAERSIDVPLKAQQNIMGSRVPQAGLAGEFCLTCLACKAAVSKQLIFPRSKTIYQPPSKQVFAAGLRTSRATKILVLLCSWMSLCCTTPLLSLSFLLMWGRRAGKSFNVYKNVSTLPDQSGGILVTQLFLTGAFPSLTSWPGSD